MQNHENSSHCEMEPATKIQIQPGNDFWSHCCFNLAFILLGLWSSDANIYLCFFFSPVFLLYACTTVRTLTWLLWTDFQILFYFSLSTSLHYMTHHKRNKSSLRNCETVCGMLVCPWCGSLHVRWIWMQNRFKLKYVSTNFSRLLKILTSHKM